MALRLATDADAAPDPRWLADVDELAALLKRDGDGVFAIVCHPDGTMAPYAAGTIEPDTIAGFSARVLAALADAHESR